MSSDANKARLIMQLRNAGITNTEVLAAIERVPRELFVPEAFRDRAYENSALPIGAGQTISQPEVVALMTQALEPDRRLKVLEVGTGSGYQAAVLSWLSRRVYTIERWPTLLHEAEARFAELNIRNITARAGDGSKGWPEQAPFPRIMVTAAAPDLPATLLDQLGEDGVLVTPVGPKHGEQKLVKLRKTGQGLEETAFASVRFVPLVAGTVADDSVA